MAALLQQIVSSPSDRMMPAWLRCSIAPARSFSCAQVGVGWKRSCVISWASTIMAFFFIAQSLAPCLSANTFSYTAAASASNTADADLSAAFISSR